MLKKNKALGLVKIQAFLWDFQGKGKHEFADDNLKKKCKTVKLF
jgi:hypothetical protein